ncbi:MAG: hypothetical protein J7K68_04260 [Candidatus Diapherotrites archaeon]|nr:hypothetical protein [Candidatus Diapherotrites archaeon]
MAEFKPTCPKCFIEKGYTVLLRKDGEVFQCPNNPKHRFVLDNDGYLKPI